MLLTRHVITPVSPTGFSPLSPLRCVPFLQGIPSRLVGLGRRGDCPGHSGKPGQGEERYRRAQNILAEHLHHSVPHFQERADMPAAL